MDFYRGLRKSNQTYDKIENPQDLVPNGFDSPHLKAPPKAYTRRSEPFHIPRSSNEQLLYNIKNPESMESLAGPLETSSVGSTDESGLTLKLADLEEENRELLMENLQLKASLENTVQQLNLTLKSWAQAEAELGRLLTFTQTGLSRRVYRSDSEDNSGRNTHGESGQQGSEE